MGREHSLWSGAKNVKTYGNSPHVALPYPSPQTNAGMMAGSLSRDLLRY